MRTRVLAPWRRLPVWLMGAAAMGACHRSGAGAPAAVPARLEALEPLPGAPPALRCAMVARDPASGTRFRLMRSFPGSPGAAETAAYAPDRGERSALGADRWLRVRCDSYAVVGVVPRGG